MTGGGNVLELARNKSDRGADGDDVDPFERPQSLEGPPEAPVAAGAAVRLGLRAGDEQKDGFRRGRAVALEESGAEADHLRATVRLEQNVVARTGKRDRSPLVQESPKLSVGVAQHLGEGRLGDETGFHYLPKPSPSGGRDGLRHRPATCEDGMSRKGADRFGRTRRAVARPIRWGRCRRPGAEHRVEEDAPSRDEVRFGRVDEVDPEVGQEGDAVRKRDTRSPEQRSRPERGSEVADRSDEG